MDRLRLGENVLDLRAGTLLDGAGTPIELRAQAFSVLAHLARHAGRVVSKDELLAAVWPGLVVTDNSIAQAVGDARAALGEAGFELIKTVPRRGYMLAASPSRPPMPPARADGPGSTLYGRDADLAALAEVLDRRRLVTVTGPGGVGKTVFARAAAQARAVRHRDGVAWVELAPVSHAALLPVAIATALDLATGESAQPLAALIAALGPLQCLLVLDNAEHLVDAVAPLVAAIAAAAPGVHLLVTSQAMLRIEAEQVFPLSTLALPKDGTRVAEMLAAPALALLVARATAAGATIEPTPDRVQRLARLTRQLDGLPLAICLAAVRLPVLGIDGLESRLGAQLALLAGGGRDAPDRQRTLRAALDWSHAQLDGRDARMFRWLGAFVGGFDPDLAVAQAAGAGVGADEALDAVQSLVERSLLQRDPIEPPRFGLLESAREYALERLEAAGERPAASRAQAEAVLGAFRRAEESLWTTSDTRWRDRWGIELDNLRTALDWCAANDTRLGLRLVGASNTFFRLMQLTHEGRRRAALFEPAVNTEPDRSVTGHYWLARANAETAIGQVAMREHARRAEADLRTCGDDRALYRALALRVASRAAGEPGVVDALAEMERIERPEWPASIRVRRLSALWHAAMHQGRHADALAAAEAGRRMAMANGRAFWAGHFMNGIAVAQLGLGRPAEAVRVCREVLADSDVYLAEKVLLIQGTLAHALLDLRRTAEARGALTRFFELGRTMEWPTFNLFSNVYFELARQESRWAAAAELLGHAAHVIERSWVVFDGADYLRRNREALMPHLGADDLERHIARGARLDPEAVCALTLAT